MNRLSITFVCRRVSCPCMCRTAWSVALGALLLTGAVERQTHAITISIEHTPENENPSWDPTGSILTAHFQAAVNIWESLLLGPEEYTLDYHWDDDLGGDLLGQTSGGIIGVFDTYIEINPSFSWFADATPNDNVEFNFSGSQLTYGQLSLADQSTYFPGAAPPSGLETRYYGVGSSAFPGASGVPGVNAANSYDLLSTIVHELGHVLGIADNEPGDYNIDAAHVGGIAGVDVLENTDGGGHLAGDSNNPGFLMCDSCGTLGRRRLPTATDVLVIAEDQGISDVKLARVGRISTGLWNEANSWIGGDVPDATQSAYITHGGTVTLDADRQVMDLLVTSGNTVVVGDHKLTINGTLTCSGTIFLNTNGTVEADNIVGGSGAFATVAGTLVKFNTFSPPPPATSTSQTFNGSVAVGLNTGSTNPSTFTSTPNSVWTVGQNLTVGFESDATLRVDGASWNVSGSVFVGPAAVGGGTGKGQLVLKDDTSGSGAQGSLIVGGNLEVQNSGIVISEVSVESGGALNVTGSILAGPSGTITYRNGITATGVFRARSGRLVSPGPPTPIIAQGGLVRFVDSHAGTATYTNEGGGFANGPGGTTRLDGASSADTATFTNLGATFANNAQGGATEFAGTANAENAAITNRGGVALSGGGHTTFFGQSTAGAAAITNEAAAPSQSSGGYTDFRDTSNAGDGFIGAQIINRGTPTGSVFPGLTRFFNSARAGDANIRMESGMAGGGRTEFRDNSNADDATLIIETRIPGTSGGGSIEFFNSASAGDATVFAQTSSFSGGINFSNSSTAGDARFFLLDGSSTAVRIRDQAKGGTAFFEVGRINQLQFNGRADAENMEVDVLAGGGVSISGEFNAPDLPTATLGNAQIHVRGANTATYNFGGGVGVGRWSTAGDATITVDGSTGPYSGGFPWGSVSFDNFGHAGNAFITLNSGEAGGQGGELYFQRGGNGDNARIETNAGTRVWARNYDIYGDTTAGSIAGGGTFSIKGGGLFIVGGRNADTIVTGPIINEDLNIAGEGGRLTKVGTGSLTLAGVNTYTGETNVDAGTLVVNGSLASKVIVKSGATLMGSGVFSGDITVNPGGTLSPGTSPGTLTLHNLTLGGGSTLNFELGNPVRDHLVVTNSGNVQLSGTLNVSFLSGFTPALGQSFPMFEGSIGSISGAFQSVVVPTVNGLTLNLLQNANSVTLQVANAPFLAGDYNGNGVVDAADYVLWRNGGPLQNEVATVGAVTPEDYTAWRARFGNTAGSGSVASAPLNSGAGEAVPEPTILAYLFSILGCNSLCRHRRAALRLQ